MISKCRDSGRDTEREKEVFFKRQSKLKKDAIE